MPFFETLSSAVASIFSNKMRSSFTMFGIIVGIAAVMLITSVGDGFRDTINAQFEDMGLDEINLVHSGSVRPVEWHERMTLSEGEFLRQLDGVLAVTANHNITFQQAVSVLASDDRRAVQLQGRDQYNASFSGPTLIYGRQINHLDVANASPVMIIDEDFSRAVFGTNNGLGRELDIRTNTGTTTFTIIGIYESDEAFAMLELFELPFEAVVPITLTQAMANHGQVVGSLRVRVEDTDTIHQMGINLIRLMEIRRGAADVFNAFSMAGLLTEVDAVIGIFTIFLAMVAGISLLVGGIGVMNIMLVSVTERTREIGIRKSLGATNYNIVFQFLTEAAFLTALGGIVGIMLGYLGGVGVGHLATLILDMELIPSIEITTILIIVAVSASIGLVFGVYPAIKAALLDPVESLRFE